MTTTATIPNTLFTRTARTWSLMRLEPQPRPQASWRSTRRDSNATTYQ
jgi:hypothetical protein